jgi:hypothetical protein
MNVNLSIAIGLKCQGIWGRAYQCSASSSWLRVSENSWGHIFICHLLYVCRGPTMVSSHLKPTINQFTDFCSKHFSVNSLLHQGLGSRKKAPPSQWEVELLKKLISTDMGHCDLFQWLNEILTPLRLTPIHAQFVSQRSE